jgi:cobalamin biosynthesis protein CobT
MYQDQKKMAEMMEAMGKAIEEAAKEAQEAGVKPGGGVGDSGLIKHACKNAKDAEDLVQKIRQHGSRGQAGELRRDQQNWHRRIRVIQDKSDEIKGHLAPILDRVKEWQERGYDRDQLKKGKLDGKRLYRVQLDEQDIFHREEDPELTDDVAFSVVIDLSGSMFGDEEGDDPLNVAFGLGAGLNKALTTIKKPCTLITFSNDAETVLDNDAKCTDERIADAMASSGGGTNIQAGITQSLKEMAKRPEKQKVMFICSDGDIGPDYLGNSLKPIFEQGVTPYFIYVTHYPKEYEAGFEKLTADALGQGHKMKYAVVKTSEAGKLIPQLTKFVEGLLQNKGI